MDEKYHVHLNTSEITGQHTCADIGYYCGKVHWPREEKTKKVLQCFWRSVEGVFGNLAFLVSGFVFCSVLLAMAGDQRRSEREMCHQRRICFAAPAAVVVVFVVVAAILVAAPREWNYYILPL
jgi:hypothetical protein